MPWMRLGSPPRGRGRPSSLTRGHLEVGLTPAWAGTAPSTGRCRATTWAHPRVGGDGVRIPEPDEPAGGSPPRGRGRPGARVRPARRRGLTPVWAGTASGRRDRGCSARAHPRVGGDGMPSRWSAALVEGSPPRGRGRRGQHLDHDVGPGLTPAWAGTASPSASTTTLARAHPRVGGDGGGDHEGGDDAGGSPPRGRGRRDVGAAYQVGPGLTPAWAGTARVTRRSARWCRAHPRVGGDGWWDSPQMGLTGGSPPRGRGRRHARARGPVTPGLTPAWAGTAEEARAA